MKVYLAILCILFVTTLVVAEPTSFEKYQANKKSLAGTIALQLLFPGAGNAYAKQHAIKSVVYPTLYYAFISGGIIGSVNAYTDQKAIWMISGISLASITSVIGMIDAVKGCERYNHRLREKYDLVVGSHSVEVVYRF